MTRAERKQVRELLSRAAQQDRVALAVSFPDHAEACRERAHDLRLEAVAFALSAEPPVAVVAERVRRVVIALKGALARGAAA